MASRYNYVLNSSDMTQWELYNVSATGRTPVPAGLSVFQNLTGLNTGTNRVAASELSVGANNICVSAIAIHNTTNWVLINMYSPDFSKSANAWFNVNTGALGTLNYTGGLSGWTHAIFINPGGIGWEIKMYGAIDSTGWHLEVRPVDSDGVHESTAGNSVGIGGWQVELGTVRTTYKPTTTAVVTRTLTSVVVSNAYNTAYMGNTMPVTVTLLDNTGAPWDQEGTITMASSNESTATVSAVAGSTNSSGSTTATVTPVAVGTTNITAIAGGVTSPNFQTTVVAAVLTRPPSLLLLGAGGSTYPTPAPSPTPPPPPPPATYNSFVNDMLDLNDEVPLFRKDIFPSAVSSSRWCGGFVNPNYAGGGSNHNMILNVAPVAEANGDAITYVSAPNSKLVVKYMVQYKSVSPFTSWSLVSLCDEKDDFFTADWYDYRGLNSDTDIITGLPYTVVFREADVSAETGGYSVPLDLFLDDPHCVLRHYNNITRIVNAANDGNALFSIQVQVAKALIDGTEADDRANIQVCANVDSDWNTGVPFMHGSWRLIPDDGSFVRISCTNIDVNKLSATCGNYSDGLSTISQLNSYPPPITTPVPPPAPTPTPAPSMLGNVAIIGDSLMRGWLANPNYPIYAPGDRLRTLLQNNGYSLTYVGTEVGVMDPGGWDVTAVGGWTVSDIDAEIASVGALNPDMIIVSIGTNDVYTSSPTIGTQMTSYLNALETEVGTISIYVCVPVNLSWFDDASYTLLRNAIASWCAVGGPNRKFVDFGAFGMNVEGSGVDGNGDGTHWSETGANKIAAGLYTAITVPSPPPPTPTPTPTPTPPPPPPTPSPTPTPTPTPTPSPSTFLSVGLRDMRVDPATNPANYLQSYALNDAPTRLRTETGPSSQQTRAQLTMGHWGTQRAWDRNYNRDYDVEGLDWIQQRERDVTYWPTLVGWDQLYQSTENNGQHLPGFVGNTRVLVFGKELWVRLISTGNWIRIATGSELSGETWRPNFSEYGGGFWGGQYTTGNPDDPVDIRHELGGTSFRTRPASGTARYYVPHTYYGYATVDPWNINAVCSLGKASLILHNGAGTDDRDYSQYLYALGADWYPPYSGPYYPGVGTSRAKYVRAKYPNWQYHVMHTLTWNEFLASHPNVT